jgi:hypothetical protein
MTFLKRLIVSSLAASLVFGSVAAVAGQDENIRHGIRQAIKEKQEKARLAAAEGGVKKNCDDKHKTVSSEASPSAPAAQ